MHAEDEFALDDYWVFTDFWQKLGIRYPDDVSRAAIRLSLARDFGDRLPSTDEL